MMRPFTLLALSLLLPLAACDTQQPNRAVGEWTLVRVVDQTGADVTGPTGSLLAFEADGSFRIASGNDCVGEYTSEFVINEQILSFQDVFCTDRATTEETDLGQVFGFYRDDIARSGPMFYSSDPSRMDISISTPAAYRTLVFTARSHP